MATAMDYVKECRICALPFVNPKLLPCHHTFCQACIKKLTKRGRVCCPNCRKTCQTRDIVVDFRLEEILEALREHEESLGYVEASGERQELQSSQWEEVSFGTPHENASRNANRCDHCGERQIAYFCVECDQWICVQCMSIHSAQSMAQHTMEPIAKKSEEIESGIETELALVQNKITEFDDTIARFRRATQTTKDAEKEMLAKSKRLRTEFYLEIDKRFDLIDGETKQIAQTHNTKMSELRDKCTTKRDHMKERFDAIEAKMHQDSEETSPKERQKILRDLYNLVETAGNPRMKVESMKLQLEKGLALNISKAVTMSATNGDVEFWTTGGDDLEKVTSKKWWYRNSVPISDRPYALRLVHGNLWQCYSNGIRVLDTRLRVLRDISCDGIGFIKDAVAVTGGDVFVATTSGLYKMDVNGQKQKKLVGGSFTGLVYYNDRVYAANSTTCTIHVYMMTNSWVSAFKFSMEATKGYCITLGITKDMCYVSLPRDNKMHVYSLSGEFQRSVPLSIANALLQFAFNTEPRNALICDTDTFGRLLISDVDNNKLHVQNYMLIWSVVTLEPTVAKPWGALLHKNKLYVSSVSGNCLCAYEQQ